MSWTTKDHFILAIIAQLGACAELPAEDREEQHPYDSASSFTVTADGFSAGGQGCWQGPFECGGAYYDETPGNWGDAQTRPGTDVDLWYDDGGIVIGGLDGLEWVTFPVRVPQSGRYAVTFRTASPGDRPSSSGVVNVGIHGVDGSWIGNQTVPVTGPAGDWHSYVDWTAPTTPYLPAGDHTLTMWAAGGWYNVRSIAFTLQDQPPPPPPPPPSTGGPVTIRVVSWNVQEWVGRPAQVQAQKLASLNPQPDVIFLQEAGSGLTEGIRAELNRLMPGSTWTAHHDGGPPILTRKGMTGDRETRIVGCDSWDASNQRTANRAKIEVAAGKFVHFFNAHLDVPPCRGCSLECHVQNRAVWFSMIDAYLGELRIAGGDLNAWAVGTASEEEVEQTITIQGMDARLTDVCADLRGSHAACYPPPVGWGEATNDANWKPDYVYRSDAMRSVSYQVVPHDGLSDHNLLVNDIEIP